MKRGFTLIELLVVITILAILAGAAIPFVQAYVSDAKLSKAKTDLDEISRALAIYETKEGEYQASDVSLLTGRYLNKSPIDPWGKVYAVATDAGVVYTAGADKLYKTSDDIKAPYLPPLAIVAAQWVDTNQNGQVDSAPSATDVVQLVMSRRMQNLRTDLDTDGELDGIFQFNSGLGSAPSVVFQSAFSDILTTGSGASKTIILTVRGSDNFSTGSDTIKIKNSQTPSLKDLQGNVSLSSQAITIIPQ